MANAALVKAGMEETVLRSGSWFGERWGEKK